MADHTYEAMWPIVDPAHATHQLVAEAVPLLADMLDAALLAPAGVDHWNRHGGHLIARVPVALDDNADPEARPWETHWAYADDMFDQLAA
jgi:hypothetical protein